jgi:hypothetical protein
MTPRSLLSLSCSPLNASVSQTGAKMDSRAKEHTRAEWRELGFFYDRNDAAKEWVLVGSRSGLLRFAQLLHRYVADPRNALKSEHEHYGPYMYLEVMTWPEAGMDDHSIHGSTADLKRLALLVEGRVATMGPTTVARIRDEYTAGSNYSLVLHLRPDDFDPSSQDANLTGEAG